MSGNKKDKRSSNWDDGEIKSYISVLEDNRIELNEKRTTKKKGRDFWNKIASQHKEFRIKYNLKDNKRNGDQCQEKWKGLRSNAGFS